ncbi:MAG: hypothetical protein GXY33_00130 [Phycisphaerae bacterium]|nr:hypothetical protein [Phycisphaerae bacterium]
MRFINILLLLMLWAPAVAGDVVARVRLDEATRFGFPELIFGAQEEIYVLPYNSVDGLKRLKEMVGLRLLRYPCGTPSDWLAWDAVEEGYWPAFPKARKKLYPDAYIELAKQLGLEPLITVNTTLYGPHLDGIVNRVNPTKVESIRRGAEYAAKWVHHANVENRSGVRYWEIGNEVWIWLQGAEYANHVREYSQAMREADPSIKLIACGLAHDAEFSPKWLKFPDDPNWTTRTVNRNTFDGWNEALLSLPEGTFDYIAQHVYLNLPDMEALEGGKDVFASIHRAEVLNNTIAMIKKHNSPVRIAITEWMVNFHWEPFVTPHRIKKGTLTTQEAEKVTLASSPANQFITTLLAADWMGRMIASGYVDIAVGHTWINSLTRNWNYEAQKAIKPPLLEPAGAAMKFWSDHHGGQVVPVTVEGGPSYVHEDETVPLISAYATTDRDKVYLVLINRSPDQTLAVNAADLVAGQDAATITEHVLSAPSWVASVWPTVEDSARYPIQESSQVLATDTLGDYQLLPSRLVCLEASLTKSSGQ